MADPWLTDPESLPIVHGGGFYNTPCIQQKVALVHAHQFGYLHPHTLKLVFTDHPCWQNDVINSVGIVVNDALPWSENSNLRVAEQALWNRWGTFVPRLLEAAKRDDPQAERRVNARLLIWLARWMHQESVATLRSLEAIKAVEAWLGGELEWESLTAQAGNANDPEAYALYTISGVAAGRFIIASKPFREHRHDKLIDMFDELLDQWAKACAEEGAIDNDGTLTILMEAGFITDTPSP